MLPYTLVLTLVWVLLLVGWVLLGIPLGPDGPLMLDVAATVRPTSP